jgi:hypothetical protein
MLRCKRSVNSLFPAALPYDTESDLIFNCRACSFYPSSSRPPSTSSQEPRQQQQQQHQQQQQQQQQRRRRLLVFIVHNIDAPTAPYACTKYVPYSTHSSLPSVQIAALIDRINAPMIRTSTELFAHKWPWHDSTALAPYNVEFAVANPSSLCSGAALTTTAANIAMNLMRTGAAG